MKKMIILAVVLLQLFMFAPANNAISSSQPGRYYKTNEYKIEYEPEFVRTIGMTHDYSVLISSDTNNIQVMLININTRQSWSKMFLQKELFTWAIAEKKRVFFGIHNILYCYKIDGTLVWQMDFKNVDMSIYDSKNGIIVYAGNTLSLVSKEDGKTIYSYDTGVHPSGGEFIDGLLFISSYKTDSVYCFDLSNPSNYKQLWAVNMEKVTGYKYPSIKSDFNCFENKLVFSVYFNGPDNRPRTTFYCLDKLTGKVFWGYEFPLCHSCFFRSIANGKLIVNDYENKAVVEIDIETGKKTREANMLTDPISNTKCYTCSDCECFYTKQGEYYYGNPRTGKNRWVYKNSDGWCNTLDSFENEYLLFRNCSEHGGYKIALFLPAYDYAEMAVGQKTMKVGRLNDTNPPKEYESAPMQTNPAIINGVTYIPSRDVFEILGGYVLWDGKTRKITTGLVDKELIMQINNPTATVNGKKVQIDPKNPKITPIIKDGRTMVPLRFLAENLGCTVKWIADTKTIIVTYQP